MAATALPEIGFYTLAGHSDSPRDLVTEVQRAEALGIGASFISERFNLKDAAVLSGAAGAARAAAASPGRASRFAGSANPWAVLRLTGMGAAAIIPCGPGREARRVPCLVWAGLRPCASASPPKGVRYCLRTW